MSATNQHVRGSDEEHGYLLSGEEGSRYGNSSSISHSQEQENLQYPQPLSLLWRLIHNACYLCGGVCFFFGSMCYFPAISQFVLGGWLFTIGSTGFLCADALEWWTNNRVGCFMDDAYRLSYEKSQGPFFANPSTFKGRYQRAENGLNFFTSVCGSTLYLIGSIYYIPALNALTLGTIIFIIGSAFIYVAQGWKLYRAGCNNEATPTIRSFSFKNWKHDPPGVIVDLTAGLGGVCYFIGSFLFLPQYDTSDYITFIGASWFQAGGSFFFASGIAMFYRYFFTKYFPH